MRREYASTAAFLAKLKELRIELESRLLPSTFHFMEGCRTMRFGGVMPAAKLKKAIISTRYPTARDLAYLLQVPKGRVERLAEEVAQFQGPVSLSNDDFQSEKPSARTVKKRATRTR